MSHTVRISIRLDDPRAGPGPGEGEIGEPPAGPGPGEGEVGEPPGGPGPGQGEAGELPGGTGPRQRGVGEPLDGTGPRAAEPALDLRVGEAVSGRVEVVALEDLEFSVLRIGLFWHTEGKGNRVDGEGGSVDLSREGEWRKGEQVEFPFTLRAPWGPVSYQGKLLKVLWELEARLERSMLKGNVREGIPVRLIPDPDAPKVELGPTPQKREQLEAAKRGLAGLWMTFAMVLFLGGVVYGASQSWEMGAGGRILVFILLASGFLLALKGMWGRLGRGKLGEPTIQLSTTDLRLGEAIRFSLSMRPEQRTELRTLDAILECEERVVHGHGQYQSHRRKVVYEKRLSLAEDILIEPHRGFRRKGTLTLPEDGPPSFGAPHNQVVWWLRFQGDIVGWPDWKEPFLLTVRP